SWGVQGEAHESEITDGAPLNSSMGVLEADIDGGIFNEEVTNTEERTYTVVGFYDRPGYALSTAAGMVGVTAGAAAPDAFTDVFLTLNDVTNTQQVEEAAEALFPDEHVVLHTAMLRYMGVSSDSSIWTTFYGLVMVLAAVIVVACVSLIFNAFNISVAERIKQFGLLSSVGASRRQLRRAVVLEGAIVAVIGIPCGLLIGLAGCAVTFAALGPALAQLAGSVEVPFRVAVNGWVLLVASVLTFVTVLVSVWIPAKRASRTNIIDSLRAASGSRVSRRGAARAAKCTAPSSLWKARGAAGRVLGVGGMLARISRKRGTGKGRAASVSLALAIVLLMTAGSLNVFLGTLTNVVTGGGEPAGQVGVCGPSWMRRRPRTKGRPAGTRKLMTEARRLAKAMLQPAVLRLPRALPSPLPRRRPKPSRLRTTSCSQRRPRCSPMPSPISPKWPAPSRWAGR
ncbi:MAG: ABC transporter permease, partial [Adlercreutzia equolifaciens]